MTTEGDKKKPGSSPEETQPPPAAPIAGEASLERFARAFETSARRWELVVYPALFAFIILAGYGFFLVYSLTQDMHTLAKNVDHDMSDHLDTMADNIEVLSIHVASMTDRMNEMSLNIEAMEENTVTMNDYMAEMDMHMGEVSRKMDTLEPMLTNIASMNQNMQIMNQAMHAMTANTGIMSRDMGTMNQSISRPMQFMNQFSPW